MESNEIFEFIKEFHMRSTPDFFISSKCFFSSSLSFFFSDIKI